MCAAPGIGGLGQLQQRGPHRGADQGPTGPRDPAAETGTVASVGGTKASLSRALLLYASHSRATALRLLIELHPIKQLGVTWRSSSVRRSQRSRWV